MGWFSRSLMGLTTVTIACSLCGCTDDPPLLPHEKILEVAESEKWVFPELLRPVHVVRTEGNVPHLYASNRRDLAYVQGFVIARDRYFIMELHRRMGSGTLSDLLGDSALEMDQESRGVGMAYAAEQIDAALSPELGEYVEAFAGGINEYIRQAKADEVSPPSELFLAQSLLGASSPTEPMTPFDRRDVCAMVAVVLYQSSYETGDVGRAATLAKLPWLFEGAPFQNLRRAGATHDLWKAIDPVKHVASAPGLGIFEPTAGDVGFPTEPPAGMAVPPALLERLSARVDALQVRLNRDGEAGFGSNAWAVSGEHSATGGALLAADGHLGLGVPAYFYRLGLDTSVFGRGDTHQLGMTVFGFPVMAAGTNGKIAWSTTQQMGDITDWYREEIQLDVEGLPARSLFDGSFQDLVETEETYVIADVPMLESVGRTETWSRWETFDGRWIADVEGRSASPDDELAPGESLVNMQGDWVVPSDMDGDGIITAVSFDYAGFDAGATLSAYDAIGHTGDVHSFREALRGMVGTSQNYAVADSAGNIMYSAYQGVPCRSYLPRKESGQWVPGADPSFLLDGTQYGAFEIPISQGKVDEEPGEPSPYNCVVPAEATPTSINPPTGYVASSNNDPAGLSFDGSLSNDAWYLGGPWDLGFRVHTIANKLGEAIEAGEADIAKMAEIQGNVESALGKLLAENMLASIDYARDLGSSPADPADQRVKALYDSDAEAMDEVYTRLTGWGERGYQARSGVETFYNPEPSAVDLEDSVATMIFNAWMSRVLQKVFDDEGLPGVWHPGGTHGRVRAIDRFLRGRGADNSFGFASHNPDTGESVFFDVLGTDEVETSHEMILAA
ncbi:MAG: penicillin acylase family protein, partial [Deltaproteobacteria bacterium]|nr:penicillin acylase family protein [Deltaproteobacteria bacterium]